MVSVWYIGTILAQLTITRLAYTCNCLYENIHPPFVQKLYQPTPAAAWAILP